MFRKVSTGGLFPGAGAAILAVIAIAALACGSGGAKLTAISTVPPETSVPGATVQPTSKASILRIGDAAKLGDTEVTVHGSRTSSGDESGSPNPGNIWVIVDVTVRNTGTVDSSLSTLLQTSLRDGNGREYTSTIGPRLQAALEEGTIRSNSEVGGEVAFEIPQNVLSGLQFVFRSIGDGQASWNLP